MRVQRVVMPVTGAESWTLVDGSWVPVAAAERYLAHLAGIERSPNTVRAYAHGLRLWFEFLDGRAMEWQSVGVEDVSRFVAWLRAPADNVIVLDDTAAVRSEATVNRRRHVHDVHTLSLKAFGQTAPDNDQQPDQTGQAGRVRDDPLPQLPDPRPALRRTTQLEPAPHNHTR